MPGLFLGALILRVSFVAYFHSKFPYFVFPDSVQYDRIAENLQKGRGFVLQEDRIAARPPLYPLFMILCGRNLLVIRLVQAVIGAVAVLLVFQLCLSLFASEAAGKLAGLAAAIDPFLIFFTGLALTETLYVFVLLAAMKRVATLAKAPSVGAAAIAGLLLGLAVLIRPALFYFPLFLLPIFCASLPSPRLGCAIGAVVALAAGLTVSPWILRNYLALHAFVPTTTQGGESLWEANNPVADGGPMMDKPIWPEGSETLPEVERDRFLRKATLQFIAENPGRFVELCGRKFVRFWNIVPNYSEYRSPFYIAVSALSTLPAFLLFLLGISWSWKESWREALVCLAPIVYTCGVHLVFVGSVRYRVPVLPYILSFAALAAVRCFRLDSSPDSPTAVCPPPHPPR